MPTNLEQGLDRLHAYWRMPYITAPNEPQSEACTERKNPFLTIPHTDNPCRDGLLVLGEHNYIVMNRYPYNAGHLLVVTRREVADLCLLSKEERSEHFDFVLEGKRILTDALQPDGFNIGYNLGISAGAGIPRHLHCHIVPRWSGDTNFMPVIANTRVLPEAMEAMWQRLKTFCN
jgi:ATP adenylyltransferase